MECGIQANGSKFDNFVFGPVTTQESVALDQISIRRPGWDSGGITSSGHTEQVRDPARSNYPALKRAEA